MKKFLLGTVALVAFAAPALAADLGARTYTKAPAYAPAPIYNWTGFYIGGHIGGAFAGDDSIAAGITASNDGTVPRRCAGRLRLPVRPELGARCRRSVQLARRHQQRRLRFTVRRHLRLLGQPEGSGFGHRPSRLHLGSGPALRQGRLCLRRLHHQPDRPGAALASRSSSSKDGYTVGGGLEYLFAQNWSGKIEYQYYDFGNVDSRSGASRPRTTSTSSRPA